MGDAYRPFIRYDNPMRENYTLKRLFFKESLTAGESVSLPKDQIHYLATVLRMCEGDEVRVFNGRNGEWLGKLTKLSKRQAEIALRKQLRKPMAMPNVTLAFAPVKRHRTAFIFEKATELGVARFEPILTARTQFPKLNLDKARAQIIEAAEQTERLDIPDLFKPEKLLDWLGTQSGRHIIFADEAGEGTPAIEALSRAPAPATLLIGPEGGFTEEERDALRGHKDVIRVSLGPRILRADTAALSLLSLWQAVQGDWGVHL